MWPTHDSENIRDRKSRQVVYFRLEGSGTVFGGVTHLLPQCALIRWVLGYSECNPRCRTYPSNLCLPQMEAPCADCPADICAGDPLGLLGVSLGLITMFSNMSDLRALAPATAVLLLTALYGGIVSGLGYLFLEPKQAAMPNIPKRAAFFCSLPIAVFTLLAMQDNLWALFGESGEVLAMGALVLILSLITPASRSLLKRIANATMYVVLILTILGVIDLAGIGATTAYADPDAYLQGMSKMYLSSTQAC